jgi:hypothetical protein
MPRADRSPANPLRPSYGEAIPVNYEALLHTIPSTAHWSRHGSGLLITFGNIALLTWPAGATFSCPQTLRRRKAR